MRAVGSEPTKRGERDLEERRVTPLELFFDLVFVFAITQVTGFLSDHPTWPGLARGLALLAALWWAWVCYSWLTNNAVRAEEATPARLVVLAAMAAKSLWAAGPLDHLARVVKIPTLMDDCDVLLTIVV